MQGAGTPGPWQRPTPSSLPPRQAQEAVSEWGHSFLQDKIPGTHRGGTEDGGGPFRAPPWAPTLSGHVECPVAAGHSFLGAQWGARPAGASTGVREGGREQVLSQPGAFVPEGSQHPGRPAPPSSPRSRGPPAGARESIFAGLLSQGRPLPGQRRLVPSGGDWPGRGSGGSGRRGPGGGAESAGPEGET